MIQAVPMIARRSVRSPQGWRMREKRRCWPVWTGIGHWVHAEL